MSFSYLKQLPTPEEIKQLNICVVTNWMPNTGIILPFISYGGTSVAILLSEMGLVLNVSRQIRFDAAHPIE